MNTKPLLPADRIRLLVPLKHPRCPTPLLELPKQYQEASVLCQLVESGFIEIGSVDEDEVFTTLHIYEDKTKYAYKLEKIETNPPLGGLHIRLTRTGVFNRNIYLRSKYKRNKVDDDLLKRMLDLGAVDAGSSKTRGEIVPKGADPNSYTRNFSRLVSFCMIITIEGRGGGCFLTGAGADLARQLAG